MTDMDMDMDMGMDTNTSTNMEVVIRMIITILTMNILITHMSFIIRYQSSIMIPFGKKYTVT